MAENGTQLEVVERFFSGTGFSYDRMVAFGTCGLDAYWKRRVRAHIPARPARIIDQACGTGIVTIDLARRYPECQVTGIELRDEYLQYARGKARALGVGNVAFVLGRAEDVVLEGQHDCIVSSYLAKYAELGPLIANAGRMLRPGGVLVLHDFSYPARPFFRAGWQVYFHLMRSLGRRVFPEWQTVFAELPSFLRATRWVSESLALLPQNAFGDLRCESLAFGAAAIVSGKKASAAPR